LETLLARKLESMCEEGITNRTDCPRRAVADMLATYSLGTPRLGHVAALQLYDQTMEY
jgi:hypothetical protein